MSGVWILYWQDGGTNSQISPGRPLAAFETKQLAEKYAEDNKFKREGETIWIAENKEIIGLVYLSIRGE